jgi:putative endonuclease
MQKEKVYGVKAMHLFSTLDTIHMHIISEWLVYIIECADHTLYTGITNDLARRMSKHENGTGAKYTRGRGPLKLVYTEPCSSKSAALMREHEIKSLTSTAKRMLFNNGSQCQHP